MCDVKHAVWVFPQEVSEKHDVNALFKKKTQKLVSTRKEATCVANSGAGFCRGYCTLFGEKKNYAIVTDIPTITARTLLTFTSGNVFKAVCSL